MYSIKKKKEKGKNKKEELNPAFKPDLNSRQKTNLGHMR